MPATRWCARPTSITIPCSCPPATPTRPPPAPARSMPARSPRPVRRTACATSALRDRRPQLAHQLADLREIGVARIVDGGFVDRDLDDHVVVDHRLVAPGAAIADAALVAEHARVALADAAVAAPAPPRHRDPD